MKLEIKVIYKEVVTPSSPTPLHLKNYKLSFIDQRFPHVIIPSALFYPANNDTPIISNSERSNRLKKSLSKALTLFYPLAGRLVGNSYVNCNDEGVTYVHAQANCSLFDVITNPIPEEISKLFPCDPEEDGRDFCLVVQVTFFSCGGLAIGPGISHKLADAVSYFMFVNSWAAFSRGDDESLVQSPKFESAILFPPEETNGEKYNLEKIVSKMFTFSPQKISDLRDKYTQNAKDDVEGSIRPTRYETLSAFIGTRIMVATKEDDCMTRKTYGLRFIVNVRTRVFPPLSEYHFGNMVVAPEITLPPLEKDDGYGACGIVMKARDAIKSVNGDDLFAFKNLKEETLKREVVIYGFTSVCSITALDKADFGWGIPVWFGTGCLLVKNTVCFLNSLSKGGIDALVGLKEEDMAKFEADEVLLEYVSCGN